MARLREKRNPGEVSGRGKHVALAGSQSPAERGIKKVFLRQLPGHNFSHLRPGRARGICQHFGGGMLPGDDRFRRRAAYRESFHNDVAIFRLLRCALGVQARHKAILNLMGIGKDVALIELQNIRKVVHPSHEAVYRARFNDVLPLSPQEFFIEDAFQCGWPQFHCRLQSLAVNRIVDRLPGTFPPTSRSV